MKYGRSRLDVFVRRSLSLSLRQVRQCLISGGIEVDDKPATSMSQIIGRFTRVAVNGQVLRHQLPVYILLNKPKGVVCATKDAAHITVLDVLNFWHIKTWRFSPGCCVNPLLQPLNYSLTQHKAHGHLHIAGRLDFNSTGLVLLTNDGAWSKKLSLPGEKVPKRYRVKLQAGFEQKYIEAFAQGLYFAYEKLTTRPAKVVQVSGYEAEVTLVEGRYHQIKRMFGAFNNKVLELHRIAVGNIQLTTEPPGSWRHLSSAEVHSVARACGQPC